MSFPTRPTPDARLPAIVPVWSSGLRWHGQRMAGAAVTNGRPGQAEREALDRKPPSGTYKRLTQDVFGDDAIIHVQWSCTHFRGQLGRNRPGCGAKTRLDRRVLCVRNKGSIYTEIISVAAGARRASRHLTRGGSKRPVVSGSSGPISFRRPLGEQQMPDPGTAPPGQAGAIQAAHVWGPQIRTRSPSSARLTRGPGIAETAYCRQVADHIRT
jgi:hypothetical protein